MTIEGAASPVHTVTRLVVIGASAGGLQALRPIVSGLLADGRTAYVLAHHMSPRPDSKLVELLERLGPLTVCTAVDGAALQPDRIHVCPPDAEITVRQLQLQVLPRDPSQHISPSIDRLFESAAGNGQAEVVAILLSGSGSDGVRGATAVRRAGGTVVAQHPDNALQPGLPGAAIDAGQVDLVGTSGQILHWLMSEDLEALEPAPGAMPLADAAVLSDILQIVSAESNVELGRYKPATLMRQTLRRCHGLGLPSLAAYAEMLRGDAAEAQALFKTFLISVSEFFRDAPAFSALTMALRTLVHHRALGESVRVWVPGCATGEEAYSIAILLAEQLGERLSQVEVRVFATDIDRAALDMARAGWYADTALANVPAAQRARWFSRSGDGWRVRQSLRDLCVFSEHNVIAHPPFIRMDLVSCRNLLIYLLPAQQRELIQTFHYSLLPGGLLFLGQSESAIGGEQMFSTVDTAHRIFRRRQEGSGQPPRRVVAGAYQFGQGQRRTSVAGLPTRRSAAEQALLLVARRFGPTAVLTGPEFEPMQFMGDAKRYFRLPDDSLDLSVFALCRQELRSELKTLCFRVMQESLDTMAGLPVLVTIDGTVQRIKPVIHRIVPGDASDVDTLWLICFEDLGPASEGTAAAPGADPLTDPLTGALQASQSELQRLRQEVGETREHLQATIEQLESANEELQALNEEVQSSTEEVQSANEELQASNEELSTLNDELRQKSAEASELSNTLTNIQDSISASLVVVDREGRITRFNALATRVFGVVARDIGTFLYGAPCHLNLPQLRAQVAQVIASGNTLVERVHQGDFHYLMQIDPYRDPQGGCVGAVLTFLDISELHRVEVAQQRSELRLRRVWESTLEGLLVCDTGGRITLANPALENMFGYGPDELLGRPVALLVPHEHREAHDGHITAFLHKPEGRRMAPMRDLSGCRKDGSRFPIEASLSSMQVDGQMLVLAAVSDITARRQAEELRRRGDERLRFALESAHAGIWDWDIKTNGNVWSDELWSLYGVERHLPASFEAWRDSIAPQDVDATLAVVSTHAAQGLPFEVVWRVRAASVDEPRWLLARGRPVLGPDGQPVRYIGIVLDITQRKLAEDALVEHRARLEQQVASRTAELSDLYNHAPCGYHSINADGVVVNINDTELGWLGYRRDEVIDRLRVQQLLAPDSLLVFKRNFPLLMGGQPLVDLELDFVRKDGSLLPVLLNARAKFDEQGRFLYSLSTMIDATAMRQADAEMARAREAAEQANRAKSSFLANMSHEIRTPLNAMLGMCHLLARDGVSPQQAARLGKIDQAGHHLLDLISDVLELSKIEAGRLDLKTSEFNLSALVNNVVSIVGSMAADKGLRVEVDLGDLPARLRGDAMRLRQALLNYVGNAVKFTEAGVITIVVRAEPSSDDDLLVRFEVGDTGPGLDAAEHARLFQPFEQGQRAARDPQRGTGLGLVITQRLARLMGGDSGVRSEAGQGSTFWFTARLARAEAGATREAALPPRALDPAAELRRHFAGARVLVAEDNPVNQEVAQSLLAGLGLVVDVACDGREAVTMAGAREYGVVLMDLNMPVLDGLQASRAIRRQCGPRPPIVALTANAFVENRAQCLSAGMDDFLTKPVDPEHLFQTVLRWLSMAAIPTAALQADPHAPGPRDPVGHAAPDRDARARQVLQAIGSALAIDLLGAQAQTRMAGQRYLSVLRVLAQSTDAEQLHEALRLSDLPAARSAAHNLFGATGAMALQPFSQAVHQIQRALRSGAPPPADLLPLAAQVRERLRTLRALITELAPDEAAPT